MLGLATRWAPWRLAGRGRGMTTLQMNRHIKVFDNPASPASYMLTYLETEPPSSRLAIGTTTSLPPTPSTFRQNDAFMRILDEVVREHGHRDEGLANEVIPYTTPIGQPGRRRGGRGAKDGRGEETESRRGGWVHLSDTRRAPEYGRIAWPEDILGSVEVDGHGQIVGRMQPSGTYRILTQDGILGLRPFLRQKLVERLQLEEEQEAAGKRRA